MGEGKSEETPTTTTAEIEELRKYSMEADLRAAEARAALLEAERRFKVMAPKRTRDTSILDDATPSKNLKTKQKPRYPNDDKLHTDPEVKASYKKIRSDPAYREMRKQMKYLRSDSTANQFDWEVYLSAAKQYLNNKEFDEDRERIRSALNEDTSKSGELERTHAMFAPEYTAILKETKEGGPSVRERYFTEPDSFRKLVKAIKLTIEGGTAPSDDVTSLIEVEKHGAVIESTADQKIHDDAEVGSWLIPSTENVKDPLKSWIERGIAVGAYESQLHLAAFFGKKFCVKRLLEKGADALLENSQGYLPIDLAEYSKSYDIVALLEEQSQIDV